MSTFHPVLIRFLDAVNIGAEKLDIIYSLLIYHIGETDPFHICVCALEKMKRCMFVQCKLVNPLIITKLYEIARRRLLQKCIICTSF